MPLRMRGFSLLGLSVAVIVAAWLAGLALNALWRYQGQVERQAVDLMVRQIRTGLQLHLLDAMTYGRREQIEQLPGSNPIELRGIPTENYLGALASPPSQEISGWYFDTGRRQLVYKPRSKSFPFRDGEHDELRWQLRTVRGSEMSVRFEEVRLGVP